VFENLGEEFLKLTGSSSSREKLLREADVERSFDAYARLGERPNKELFDLAGLGYMYERLMNIFGSDS